MQRGLNIANWRTTVFLLNLLLVLALPGFSQQEPISTLYMNNLLSVNPAYASMTSSPYITSIHRTQWIKLDGNSNTSSLTFAMPVDSMHIGAGFDFIFDHTRPVTKSGIYANYAYKFYTTPHSQISLGLKAGASFIQTHLTELDRYHEDDSYILQYGDFTKLMPNFGVGVYYYTTDFYVGFSIPKIIQNKYYKEMDDFDPQSREERHIYLQGSYTHQLSQIAAVKTSLTTIMVEGAPITADFDLAFLFMDNKFALGAMYRISDAVGAYTQIEIINNLRLGFAFDYTKSELRRHQKGTVEFMLRYEFKSKYEKSLGSPRYF